MERYFERQREYKTLMLGLWTPWRLDSGRLSSDQLDGWTGHLDGWTLDSWTLHNWTLRLWTLVLWSTGRSDSGHLDGWTLDAWILDDWKLGLWTLGHWTLDAWTLDAWTLGLWTTGRLVYLLYNSIFKGQLSYCPLIWTFRSRRSNNLINKLQKKR